jgi:putative membrane protein
MDAVLNSLATGVPELAKYLALITLIYLIGVVTYVKLSPHKELELVQNGNMAAAVTFSALIISLALPLIACLVNRLDLKDVAVWGTFSLFLQLFLFRLTDLIFKGMPDRIENDEVPAAIVLASFKLAGSIALAVAVMA